MALSLRGTANASINGTSKISVTLPVGVAENDVVYFAFVIGSNSNLDLLLDTSGYTELVDIARTDDSLDVNLGVFRKIQSATPDSVVTASHQNNVDKAGCVHVWTGADTTTPEDATSTTASGFNGGTANPPSITTVTTNAIVLAIGGSSEPDTVTNPPTNYSNLDGALNSATANPQAVWVSSRLIVSAGSENPGSYADISGDINDSWCAATVAIRPAAEAATSILRQMLSHGLFVGSYT